MCIALKPYDFPRKCLWAYVYDLEIEITPRDICNLINLDTRGDNQMTAFERKLFYDYVFDVADVEGDNWDNDEALNAKILPLPTRVPHLYLVDNDVPSAGNHHMVTHLDFVDSL